MPLTTEKYQKSLAQPPLCEQLKVRDLTDDLLIQLNGSFVAGYRVSGIHSYYASDDEQEPDEAGTGGPDPLLAGEIHAPASAI